MSEQAVQGMLLEIPAADPCERESAPKTPPRFRMIDRDQMLLRTVDVESWWRRTMPRGRSGS